MTTVLFVEGCRDGTVGGSHTCLRRLVQHLDRRLVHPIVVFYEDHALAQDLRDAGADVVVLPNTPPADLTACLTRAGVPHAVAAVLRPLQQAHNLARHFLVPVWRARRLILDRRVDVVHVNNSIATNHEWMVAALAAGTRLVSHERGISGPLTTTSRRLAQRVHAFLCVSRVVQDELISQGVSPERSQVIYDGIDSAEVAFTTTPESLRNELGLAHDVPVVGVLGNVKRWKGQRTLVEALAALKDRHPDVVALLVGTVGDDAYRAEIEAVASAAGIAHRIMFTGFQRRTWDFLRLMDVVVHTSVAPEPFGMVNLEAMYVGKPVVSTTIGAPAEVFDHGRTGFLIPPGDAGKLADVLAVLLSDAALRDKVGSAARVAAMHSFRIEDTVEQTLAVYGRLTEDL